MQEYEPDATHRYAARAFQCSVCPSVFFDKERPKDVERGEESEPEDSEPEEE